MKFLLLAGYADSLLNFRGPLLKALLASGLEVHVAAPFGKGDAKSKRELESLGIRVHHIPLQRTGMNPVADLSAIFSLLATMRNIRPDYVLGYTIKPVIYGSLVARLCGVRHRFAMITGLGYTFQGESGARNLLKLFVQILYRYALNKSSKVFFQNPDDRELFRSLNILGKYSSAVIVNGSGVDVKSFSVAAFPESPRFLLIARLLGDKGVREYAQAAALVKARHPEVTFELVGWIDDNPDSIAQAELDSWVNAGVVRFLGRLDDVRPAISDSSVYVLPSYREGTPRTVLEAMAMGRAIITTDAPGCRETVVDGDNGFLVPVKGVSELAEAMNRFVENTDLIRSMGQRSREIAEQKYDVHKVNQFMLAEMEIK